MDRRTTPATMPRLPSLLCTVALLVAAVAAGLYLRTSNAKRVVEQRLARTEEHATRLAAELANANRQGTALKTRAAKTADELARTETKLAAAEARARQLDDELGQAKSTIAVYEQTSRTLADEVSALRKDLEAARRAEASPEAVAGYKNTIAELERQLAQAHDGAAVPSAAGAATAVFSSRPGHATVLTVGPESAFVVLNFGAERGAQVGQKLNVSQGSAVVATVLVSDVRNNFSIAHVLPDTLRGVLHKGDSALLLR